MSTAAQQTPPNTSSLLASPDDLALWFEGVSPSDAKLIEALREASDRFRAAVRHHVSREHRVVVLDGLGARYLRLPSMNVDASSVLCIEIGADATTAVLPVSVSTTGVIQRIDGAAFPYGLGNVSVEYDAGYLDNEIPPDIQAVVLDQARVLYALKRGIQWLAVGAISTSYSASDATGVTQAWADAVELYRIRVGDRS